jgi:hypothetical protein
MRKLLVALVAMLAIVGLVRGAAADPIEELAGFWSGGGSVVLTNGKTERVKCQVFYKTGEGSIRQTMRCASADYSINSLAELRVNGGQVNGNWEEKTYAAKGAVTGRYGGDGFTLTIQGGNFSAAMNVALSNCRQSINISPQGLEVSKVAIALAKERCGS